MNLAFYRSYKSIKQLPIAQLPGFTIITGENGAGKTHFLEALKEGDIRVDEISSRDVRYYAWGAMVPSDEGGVVPRNNGTLGDAWDLHRFVGKALEEIAYRIGHQTGALVTADHLTQSQHQGPLFQAMEPSVQRRVRAALIEFNEQLLHLVTEAAEGRTQEFRWLLEKPVENVAERRRLGSNPNVLTLRDNLCQSLVQVVQRAQKDLLSLNQSDCVNNYPLTTTQIDPFTGSLTKLFAAYVRERERNDLDRLRHERGEAATYLSNDAFLRSFGPPPWEVVNGVLADAGLGFRFLAPSPNAGWGISLKLKQLVTNEELSFSDLSSGERILISLAQYLFLAQDTRQLATRPRLVLLDEIDAPLHPSMAASLLRIVETVMVQQQGVHVILATHSPSTVALAPEEAIHVMDVGTKRLRKTTRDEAVRVLTAGVPVLSIDRTHRRQVFVESHHDAGFYESIAVVAKPLLVPDISLTFIASGHAKDGGCGRVKDLVHQLSAAGNRTVFGIVDWDGHHVGTAHVKVLGEGTHHSIENYLFDPVLLGALLFRERQVTREALLLGDGQSHTDLRHFTDNQLQAVADNVLRGLGWARQADEPRVSVQYSNGRSVQLPRSYAQQRGHDLEHLIKTKYPGLHRFRREADLKKEILGKVLDELPGLLPQDLVALLLSIQGH